MSLNSIKNDNNKNIESNSKTVKNSSNVDAKEAYIINGNNFSVNKEYSDNSLLYMNKEIDNLNKKNEEIFKIIYKDSKLFQQK